MDLFYKIVNLLFERAVLPNPPGYGPGHVMVPIVSMHYKNCVAKVKTVAFQGMSLMIFTENISEHHWR